MMMSEIQDSLNFYNFRIRSIEIQIQELQMELEELEKNKESLSIELKQGYVKIEGCDNATGFVKICKESDLQKVGKEIFAEHPGDDGYYDFNKFLWVSYPDGRNEVRLDSLVEYD